jgi:hypothetical protein
VAKEKTFGINKVAAELGVKADWVRSRIADGSVTPARPTGRRRKTGPALSEADLETLRQLAAEDPAAGGPALLARYSQIEAERANLLAQVAWERAIAQEQQKSLESERSRAEKLATELDEQRKRIEALKSLSAWDRFMGRHKAI